MDVDPSMSQTPNTSRDPRLNRPPLNHRLSHHEAQQRVLSSFPQQAAQPAPEDHTDTSTDSFICGISELVQAAAATAATQSEKEKLEKKRGTTADLLRKARKNQDFPATIEFFQNAQNEEDQVLAKIDQKIKENETKYKRLQADLKTRWAATKTRSLDSQSKDMISNLQEDFNKLRDRSRSRDDQTRDLGKDLKDLQDTLRSQQRDHTALATDVQTLQQNTHNQQKEFAEFTNHLSRLQSSLDGIPQLRQLEKGSRPLPHGTANLDQGITADTQKALDDLTIHFKKLEEKTNTWGEKTGFLSSSYQRISSLPDQLNQTLRAQQVKLDGLGSYQTDIAKLNATVAKLNSEMEVLQNIQSTKDDLLFAQIEALESTLTRVKTDHERLTGQLEQLTARIPTEPLEPKFAGLGVEVQHLREGLVRQGENMKALSIGLVSLETRYNNLSTEPIVQHMLGALQEMYPQWDPAHKMLSRKVEQLDTQARLASFAAEEVVRLKIEQGTLSQKLGSLIERYEWFNQEEFRQVQTRVADVSTKQNNMEGDLTSKKTADQALFQEVERERESLNSRINSLSQSIDMLKAECAEARTSTDNDKTDLRSLEFRIGDLEKSSKKLKEQVDTLANPPPRRELFPENGGSTGEQTPKMQAPPWPNKPDLLDTAVKVKRRHASTVSDDETPPTAGSRSQDSLASPTIAHGNFRKKKKKKKKRMLEVEGPIEIDD
ncbi:hypothetical protein BJX64DRAFT_289670 [Aspergillus heterothallicus]